MDKVYVDLLGHEAEVERIKGELKFPPWHKEDHLVVWLSFKEAVGSTLSFGIGLPVRNYGRDELLQAIKAEGNRVLKKILDDEAQKHAEREAKEKRQEELDSLAGQLQQMINR